MTTYAIVHGAGDVAANWEPVAAELRARGHDVVSPDLPCEDEAAGLERYTDTVVEAIGDRSDGLVVVAHSLGGFTAPLVTTRVPVDRIVLIAAMVPAPGETGIEWWDNTGHTQLPKWPDSERELFLQDVSPETAAAVLARSRNQTRAVMEEPWPLAAWPDVATRFLLCREDRCFPADWLRDVVRDRLGITPEEIDGGHMPYVSRPTELAAWLANGG
jgi:pimeloyl-ACP methyl ester carboxylesterase